MKQDPLLNKQNQHDKPRVLSGGKIVMTLHRVLIKSISHRSLQLGIPKATII